jgi:hypothetical protein
MDPKNRRKSNDRLDRRAEGLGASDYEIAEKIRDARKNLTGFIARLKQFAEAARADANIQDRRFLAQDAEALNHAHILVGIIGDYEKLVLWISDLYPRLCSKDQDKYYNLGLEPFDSGGSLLLHSVLLATLDLGGRAPKSPMKMEELEKLRKTLTASAREALQRKRPQSHQINELIARGLEQGLLPKQILQTLADERLHLSEPALRKRVERLKKSNAEKERAIKS